MSTCPHKTKAACVISPLCRALSARPGLASRRGDPQAPKPDPIVRGGLFWGVLTVPVGLRLRSGQFVAVLWVYVQGSAVLCAITNARVSATTTKLSV
jgi:hypothetical protein